MRSSLSSIQWVQSFPSHPVALLRTVARVHMNVYYYRSEILRIPNEGDIVQLGSLEAKLEKVWPNWSAAEEGISLTIDGVNVANFTRKSSESSGSCEGSGQFTSASMDPMQIELSGEQYSIQSAKQMMIGAANIIGVVADSKNEEFFRFQVFPECVEPLSVGGVVRNIMAKPAVVTRDWKITPFLPAAEVPRVLALPEHLQPVLLFSALRFCVGEALLKCSVTDS